jgi:D-glycero-D-manno-heptose 1,7-bisphosphate phosphatase
MGIDRNGAAVFLDRDGVINRPVIHDGRPHPPADAEALEVLPGVSEALERLRAAGFFLVIVTNQPDVARGTQTREAIDRIHERLRSVLPLDDIRVCVHDDADGCRCRKPSPGLLEDAARDAGLSLADSFMVGDRWRDIEAGRRAGCTTVFIDWAYDERRPEQPDAVVASLPEAADWVLARAARGRP